MSELVKPLLDPFDIPAFLLAFQQSRSGRSEASIDHSDHTSITEL